MSQHCLLEKLPTISHPYNKPLILPAYGIIIRFNVIPDNGGEIRLQVEEIKKDEPI